MARISYVDPDQLSADDGELVNRSVNISRLMAHSPGLVRAISSFSRYVRRETALPQRFVEIGILTVGWETRSAYEWAHHLSLAKSAGVTEEEIAAVMDKGKTAEPARSIIKAARDITHSVRMDDTTFATLEATLGPSGFVDLVYFLGVYNGIARFLTTFEVEVEDSYTALLAEYPSTKIKPRHNLCTH